MIHWTRCCKMAVVPASPQKGVSRRGIKVGGCDENLLAKATYATKAPVFLPDGVMVARLALNQLVKVRVLLGQLGISAHGVVVSAQLSDKEWV